MNKKRQQEILKNWYSFNHEVIDLSEKEILSLLEVEVNNRCRSSYVDKLHQRFSRLRADRERAQLKEGKFILSL